MSLAAITAPLFDKHVRSRGELLYATRKIRVESSGQDHFYAQVRGGDVYEVRIAPFEQGLEVSCECVYFEDYGPCKHLWTAILEADRHGALAGVRQVLFLQTELDPYHDDESSAHRYIPLPQAVRVPAWQEYLGEVERAIKAKSAQRMARPRPTEILYCIDVASSKAKGKIALELLSRTRKKDGDWSPPKEYRLTPEQAASLPDPLDVEVLSALLGGQDLYTYTSYSTGITRKTITLPLAVKLLPPISAVGRLF